jgi:putative copper resistance protein D
VHIGGAVMWVGGAGLMFVLLMTVFFAWSREQRADGGLGWLEAARRTNFATVVGAAQKASPGRDVPHQAASADDSVDDDEHLAAYNAYLARLNQQDDH